MGLDVYLYQNDNGVELNSKKYPEHLFKIGYFRSSYNRSGFNSVAEIHGLPGLYQIFPQDNEEYEFTPDWKSVKENIENVLRQWEEYLQKPSSKYRPVFVTCRNAHASNEQEALKVFCERVDEKLSFRDFSCNVGRFHLDGMKIYGVIPGKSYLDSHGVYLICEEDLVWFYQALEIVKETIDHVLESNNPQEFSLRWSA